jgi:hypothetical protein
METAATHALRHGAGGCQIRGRASNRSRAPCVCGWSAVRDTEYPIPSRGSLHRRWRPSKGMGGTLTVRLCPLVPGRNASTLTKVGTRFFSVTISSFIGPLSAKGAGPLQGQNESSRMDDEVGIRTHVFPSPVVHACCWDPPPLVSPLVGRAAVRGLGFRSDRPRARLLAPLRDHARPMSDDTAEHTLPPHTARERTPVATLDDRRRDGVKLGLAACGKHTWDSADNCVTWVSTARPTMLLPRGTDRTRATGRHMGASCLRS